MTFHAHRDNIREKIGNLFQQCTGICGSVSRTVDCIVGCIIRSVVLSTLTAVVASAQPSPPDSIVRRPLVNDTIIDGVPCAKTGRAPAEFHLNQRLAGCAIARDHQVRAHHFATGTWLDFNAQAVLWGAWLSRDTRLDGYNCRGEGYKRWSVRFHTNGKLAGCYLAADTVVAGVPCMRGSFLREMRTRGHTSLQLYSNGSFRQCVAARDTISNGRTIKKWQVVARDSAPKPLP